MAEQVPVQPHAPPVAQVPAAPNPVPTSPASAPSRASSIPPTFVGQVHAALRRVQRYPAGARARRAQGVVTVSFTLTRDGRVLNVRLSRSSGEQDFDEEALAMMERVSMPSLPGDYTGDNVPLVVPISFMLR
ncbi:energy transducer TonB [Muricoccus aerilatus]|uniref:energy transducer TonB n=1 Tax=Muricoccus aerilatus TaxID=452982 RepID=UPI0009FD14D7|nr:energy transducer TonB [Roseomonas aerilata]